MAIFTNKRITSLGSDGKPVKIKDYTFDKQEASRSLEQIEKLVKKMDVKKK